MTDQKRLMDVSFAEGGADPSEVAERTEFERIDVGGSTEKAVVFVFESVEDKAELIRQDPHFLLDPAGNEATWEPETQTLFGEVGRDSTRASWYRERVVDDERVPPELEAWRLIGLPDFEPTGARISLRVRFDTDEARDALVEKYQLVVAKKTRGVLSCWWPPRPREDLSSLRFDVPPGQLKRLKIVRETVGEQGSLFDEPKKLRRYRRMGPAGEEVRFVAEGFEAYCWYGDHWLPMTAEFFYRNRAKGDLHTTGRCKECEALYRHPVGPLEAQPRYPIYVVSKGRWQEDRAITIRSLLRDKVPFHVVVEPQERDDYLARVPAEQILVLPFSNLGRGSIPARNWIKDHATTAGYKRHWILDDNIIEFRRLWKGRRIPCHAGVALRVCEDLTDSFENVAISGLNYQMFVTAECPTPFYRNVHVYSCTLIDNEACGRDGEPLRWRGRYNEDTDLCLQALDAGHCTILMNAFMANKLKTMAMGGGNTDQLYAGDGRLAMARSLEAAWPGIVKTKWRFGRPQHVVRWDAFEAPLQLHDHLATRQAYGLQLQATREVGSETLRRLLRETRSLP